MVFVGSIVPNGTRSDLPPSQTLPPPPRSLLVQSLDPLPLYLALAVLAIAMGTPFVFRHLGEAGRAPAYLALVMTLGLFGAQGWGSPRATFPFVDWTMYSEANVSTVAWSIAVHEASGEVVDAGSLLAMRGASTRAFHRQLYFRAGMLRSSDRAQREKAERELFELFQALSDLREARGGAPFHAVTLVRCDVRGTVGRGRAGTECDPATRMTLYLAESHRGS